MTPERIEEMSIANTVAIARLAEVSTQTSQDVDKIIKHLEESKPLRGEVEALVDRVEDLEGTVVRKFDVLNPVFTILRYPKLALASIVGLYVMTYSQLFDNSFVALLQMVGMSK